MHPDDVITALAVLVPLGLASLALCIRALAGLMELP